MKEFLEMKENVSKTKTNTFDRYKELLTIVTSYRSPQIRFITEVGLVGDLLFNINLEDIGLTDDVIAKYNKEIFSNLFVDFIGELIIRDNIDEFVVKINKLDFNHYQQSLSVKHHSRFGMKINKGLMIFKFHMSLLQGILTEDFKTI